MQMQDMQMQDVRTGPTTVGLRSGSDEFVRLIVKLRWIGLDEEAERLQRAVRAFGPQIGRPALAEPASTD